jgi:hypothetical protein
VWEDLDTTPTRPFKLFKKWFKERCIYRPNMNKETDPLYFCRTCEDLEEPGDSYIIFKGFDE